MKKALAFLTVLALCVSFLPVQGLAFSADFYKANITEIHIGAPIPGMGGRSFLPTVLHFSAQENIADQNSVWFLEGYLQGVLSNGQKFEGINGLGMTLMGPLKPDAFEGAGSNAFSWEWNGWESGGIGAVMYHLPLLNPGEQQTVQESQATGQLEVNALKPGDSVSFRIETVMNQSNFPAGVLPESGSLFSDTVTVTIEDSGNYPKTITAGACSHEWVWYNTDDISHYQYCTKCEAVKEGTEGSHTWSVTVNTPATCAKDAVITKTCAVCGRVNTSRKPDPATDAEGLFAHHTWKEAWDYNTVSHWQTCSVCGVTTEHKDHCNYSNIKVVTPRTCTENATVTATCGICGANVTLLGNELKALNNPDYLASGHDFSGPLKYDKSTCTAEGQGNHAPTCVNCGLRDSEHATAHSWTGLHNVSNGTCGDPNDPVIQEATCECGATLHLEKQREHVPVADTSKDVQATCTEPGKINGHRCTICGLFYDYETVEALGHDFVKDDEKKADCTTEGYIHYTCSRCKEEKTETIEKMSKTGQHKWVKKIGLAPTCLKDGTYDGEICEVCKAERKQEGDYGKLEALGHKVHAETAQHGRVRKKVALSGVPMDITTYLTIYSCTRCGERLGAEYWTVATASAGAATNGAKYEIVSGKNAEITDMQNGIHINGNMADDGGVQFNGTVLDALNEVIEGGKSKYQYKKIKANSFIIEFTDEFLAGIEDGAYPVEIFNGSEYWPMLVTVKDHKLVGLADMEIPDAPEMTETEFDAFLAEQKAGGVPVKEYYVLLERAPAYLPGDVDGNGAIEAADARLALRRSVDLEDYPEGSAAFLACDVDFDNEITAGDARLILRASVGLEDPETWKR